MDDFGSNIIKRLTHWPSTVEGVVWFEVITRGWEYLTEFLKCDMSEVSGVGFLGGVVMFARFALSKGVSTQKVLQLSPEVAAAVQEKGMAVRKEGEGDGQDVPWSRSGS